MSINDRTAKLSYRRAAVFAALSVLCLLALGAGLAAAVAPVVTVDDAEDVAYTTAHVKGTVNPEDRETFFHFEYITDAQLQANAGNSEPPFQGAAEVGHGSLPENAGATPVSEQLAGLQPGTVYHLRLVASNTDGEAVEAVAANTFETDPVAKPIVSGLTASATEFSGFVDPNAPKAASELEGGSPEEEAINGAFATHWSFTCEPSCSFSGESAGDLKADDSATEVTATPAELTPNETYDVILHASNAGGEETETVVDAITTAAIVPTIERATPFDVTPTSIQLNSIVHANNATLTDCHFAYGAGGTLDQTVPCESLPPDNIRPSVVSAKLNGLIPGTEYSFKFLATNIAGTAEGDVHTFTTLLEPTGGESCPNEGIREAQDAVHLPDCRAWEKVSPAEKGHGNIVADGVTNTASVDGDAVTLHTRTPFGDTIGSGVSGHTQYLARRSAGGWATHSIAPQPRADASQVLNGPTRFQVFSDDLRHAVVFGYDYPAVTGDVPLRNNIYVEETATRALRPVTALQPGGLPDPLPHPQFEVREDRQWGVSADAQHVAFVSRTSYLPAIKQAKEPGGPQNIFTPNVYQWDDGTLSLAGILPDGAIPPEGSDANWGFYRDAMSDDGSRQLFLAAPTAGAQGQLYQRIDGNRTVWISEPEGADQGEPTGVSLKGATPDGRNVLFITNSPLVDADEAPGPDLYRWTDGPNPASEGNLTLITHTGDFDPGLNSEVAGVSDDGQRIYYATNAQEMMVWDHGETRVAVPFAWAGKSGEKYGLDRWGPGLARVTPDGRYIALVSYLEFEGEGKFFLYLYDLENDTVNCVSCPFSPVFGTELVTSVAAPADPSYAVPGIRPRFLASDGTVFFSSPEQIVPRDTNGTWDAYRYDPATGETSLLSSGVGKHPTSFVEADANGSDVFLATRNQLVPSDTDELVDLYDVRSGGGFAEPVEPPPAPCVGEGCQGTAGQAPLLAAPASRAEGRGNVVSRKPGCGKKRRGAKAKATRKQRCGKRGGARNDRPTSSDRRAAK